MATKSSTVEYILEQLSSLNDVHARKMFGEYALYANQKVVGLICNDQLYLKPTEAGRQFLGTPDEAPPYPGAKNYYLVSGDFWDDKEWLCELISRTSAVLPLPKPKKK
jgi:DNA transformation protein